MKTILWTIGRTALLGFILMGINSPLFAQMGGRSANVNLVLIIPSTINVHSQLLPSTPSLGERQPPEAAILAFLEWGLQRGTQVNVSSSIFLGGTTGAEMPPETFVSLKQLKLQSLGRAFRPSPSSEIRMIDSHRTDLDAPIGKASLQMREGCRQVGEGCTVRITFVAF